MKDEHNPKIILKKWDYDILNEIEKRMTKNKDDPMWNYGLCEPSYYESMPKRIKDRKRALTDNYQRKMTVKKIQP